MKGNRTMWVAGTGLALLLGVSLLGGTATSAQAQTQESSPRPVRILGRVQSVSANSLALESRRGQVTANVGASAWILVESEGRCVEGTLQQVQTQALALVAGMTTGQESAVNARLIVQGRACMRSMIGHHAKQAARHLAGGTISAISGNSITLDGVSGQQVTVNTTADTLVINNGFKPVSSLKVGDKVGVLGRPDKEAADQQSRTLQAWAIRVETQGSQLAVGKVESVTGNSVKLVTPKNPEGITLTLGTSTQYKAVSLADGKATPANATQADIKPGSRLIVEGQPSADGKSLNATAVIILPERAAKP